MFEIQGKCSRNAERAGQVNERCGPKAAMLNHRPLNLADLAKSLPAGQAEILLADLVDLSTD
jgi:hypothetical protein